MAIYISNAFSLQMQGEYECKTKKVSVEEAMAVGQTAYSCVGHADVAAVLSGILGYTVPVNRVNISLKPGDKLIVGQYVGPRLPEGCKTLPEGARIEWYVVECY